MIIKMVLGQIFKHSFLITQEQVNIFSEISGDNNPIHLDHTYAETTVFKKPIIHGIFGASIFSKYFGTIMPGEGTIYLKQSLDFLRPMFIGIEYDAIMTIREIDTIKNKALIDCKIIDKITGKATITGEAQVLNKEKIK